MSLDRLMSIKRTKRQARTALLLAGLCLLMAGFFYLMKAYRVINSASGIIIALCAFLVFSVMFFLSKWRIKRIGG